MALTNGYLITTKNVKAFFDSLIGAKAPDSFTQKFIENLGFGSSNDRLFIPVLKGLGFLDENASPTDLYFKFLDQSESKKVLASAIEQAYGDLFAVNKEAYKMELSDVKGKLRSITQGKHSENVIGLMAATFKALCEYADWQEKVTHPPKKQETIIFSQKDSPDIKPESTVEELEIDISPKIKKPEFHYNIQVHLPESRDEAVYEAIFKSLRKHLL
jgi:hypothetical protein